MNGHHYTQLLFTFRGDAGTVKVDLHFNHESVTANIKCLPKVNINTLELEAEFHVKCPNG